jgi:hypothetical protein
VFWRLRNLFIPTINRSLSEGDNGAIWYLEKGAPKLPDLCAEIVEQWGKEVGVRVVAFAKEANDAGGVDDKVLSNGSTLLLLLFAQGCLLLVVFFQGRRPMTSKLPNNGGAMTLNLILCDDPQ